MAFTHSRLLNPLEAYQLAQAQKEAAAQHFIRKIYEFYERAATDVFPLNDTCCTDGSPTARSLALRELCTRVKARCEGQSADQQSVKGIFRTTYREVALEFGLQKIDPKLPDFSSRLDEFYRNYITNFPIKGEQESLAGFEALLSAPERTDGYVEVAYNVICPLTGNYLLGVNFTIQPASNSAHFIYGFVAPRARKSFGFSRALVEIIRSVSSKKIGLHPSSFPGDVLITFEKNILGEMTLCDVLADSAGADVCNPPSADANLCLSSIDQSIRDLVWSRLGAKIVDYNYIQCSLEGVVEIGDPESSALAIRYLNKDGSLPAEGVQDAERIIAEGLVGREEGCRVLNLCVFAPVGAQSLSAAQLQKAMEIFQGVSVVKCPDDIWTDIYFKASMTDLAQKTINGRISLKEITPFGGNVPAVETFEDAAKVTEILLKVLTWDALSESVDRRYADWIAIKFPTICPSFANYKNESGVAR